MPTINIGSVEVIFVGENAKGSQYFSCHIRMCWLEEIYVVIKPDVKMIHVINLSADMDT